MLETGFLNRVKVGKIETSIVFAAGFLSVFVSAWFVSTLFLVVLWIGYHNRRPLEPEEARTIDLPARKRCGFLVFVGTFVVLMLAGVFLNVTSSLELYAIVFDPNDLEAFSSFGLYNHDAGFYRELFDSGYKKAAVFSKFTEFSFKTALILSCCIWFVSITKISVLQMNAKQFGMNKKFLFVFLMIVAPTFLYLGAFALGGHSNVAGFVDKYTSNGNLNNSYFYLTAFKYWFVFIGNIALTIPFLGKVLFALLPTAKQA